MSERSPRRLSMTCFLIVGCASSPDYVGVYEITAHTWIAEIEVGAGELDCSATGHPVDDGDPYFALVTDAAHSDAVQYLRCADAASCTTPRAEYAWFTVDGASGINAQAIVVNQEFSSPYCDFYLETFEITASMSSLHIDRLGRRASNDDIAGCTLDHARALATESTCIWVEQLDGRPVQ